jgi:hypothetical protein
MKKIITLVLGCHIAIFARAQWTTNGSTGDAYNSNASGKVGIGTTSPSELLHVYSTAQYPRISVQSTSASGAPGFDIRDASGTPRFTWHYDIGNGFMGFFQGGVGNRMVINNSGNVGIGTTQPDYPLTVNGSIHAKEVRVDLNVPAPDYVFEKDYQLTSLEDIKTYIDQNKHLPEVPSAKEMEKNGVQLGEMNMILLRKIEELTLHAIEQNKMIEEMKKENEKQNILINELRKQK